MKKKYFIFFIFLYSLNFFNCNGTKSKLNKETEICIKSLNVEINNLSNEQLLVIKQFFSNNGCNDDTKDFIQRAITALNKGDLNNISLSCLNNYFEMNQNSPFNISFGGAFNCESY